MKLPDIKQSIKQHRKSDNALVRLMMSAISGLLRILSAFKRFLLDPEYRYIETMRFLHPNSVHQTTAVTYMDRYPEVFAACAEYFKDKQNLKILSFGCSTGEEVLTLRSYFPAAAIIGADINKRSLRKCRKLQTDSKISFVYSSDKKLRKLGPFDAIFCMAVFQRTPHAIAKQGIHDIKDIYPFEKFEQQVVQLSDMVNPRGLLINHFSQYALMDTRIASEYLAFGDITQQKYALPVFDKSSIRIDHAPPFHSIYIKSDTGMQIG